MFTASIFITSCKDSRMFEYQNAKKIPIYFRYSNPLLNDTSTNISMINSLNNLLDSLSIPKDWELNQLKKNSNWNILYISFKEKLSQIKDVNSANFLKAYTSVLLLSSTDILIDYSESATEVKKDALQSLLNWNYEGHHIYYCVLLSLKGNISKNEFDTYKKKCKNVSSEIFNFQMNDNTNGLDVDNAKALTELGIGTDFFRDAKEILKYKTKILSL